MEPTISITQQLSDDAGVCSEEILFEHSMLRTLLCTHHVRYGFTAFNLCYNGDYSYMPGTIYYSPDFVWQFRADFVPDRYWDEVRQLYIMIDRNNSTATYQPPESLTGWNQTQVYTSQLQYPYSLLDMQGVPFAHAPYELPPEYYNQYGDPFLNAVELVELVEFNSPVFGTWTPNPYGSGGIGFYFSPPAGFSHKGVVAVTRHQYPWIMDTNMTAQQPLPDSPANKLLFLMTLFCPGGGFIRRQ